MSIQGKIFPRKFLTKTFRSEDSIRQPPKITTTARDKDWHKNRAMARSPKIRIKHHTIGEMLYALSTRWTPGEEMKGGTGA